MSDNKHHRHSKHHHRKENDNISTNTQKNSIFEDLESAKKMVDKYSVFYFKTILYRQNHIWINKKYYNQKLI